MNLTGIVMRKRMMTDRTITLVISETVYSRASQIANHDAQPIESVLAQRLEEAFDDLSVLPAGERSELTAFQYLSDDTLFSIAREHIPHMLQDRMVILGDRTSRGTVTSDEATEYGELVERGNRLTLRKAWAADVLMSRGYK